MLTHIIYGIRSPPAHAETLKDVIITARMRSHRTTIIMTPPPFDLIPKKITDHRALNISCTQNKMKASKTPSVDNPFCQTRKTEIPIRIYRVVQTGPNTQLGGVYGGFLRLGYQVGIALKVKRLLIPPAAKLAKMLIISLMMLFKSIGVLLVADVNLFLICELVNIVYVKATV